MERIRSEFVFTAAGYTDITQEDLDALGPTHALRVAKYRKHTCCLIFGNREGPIDYKDIEHHQEIANSPVTHEFLGENFVIFPYYPSDLFIDSNIGLYSPSTKTTMLIASAFTNDDCRSAIEKSKADIITLVQNGSVTHTNSYEIAAECHNPEKFVGGCESCSSNYNVLHPCAITRMSRSNTSPDFEVDTYMESVRYWKTHIGKFVAIGPTMTCEEVAAPSDRLISEHSFRNVNASIQHRRTATETLRDTQFLHKTVCPACTVKDACWTYGSGPRGCSANYPEPYKKIATHITKQIKVPYTTKQIYTLLENSGELDKRIRRFISYATFKIINNELAFIIRARSNPHASFHISKNYEHAINLLKSYNSKIREPSPFLPRVMPVEDKATFLELLSRSYSPRYRAGWHSTSYSLLCVALTGINKFVASYSWNNKSGQELPWRACIANLHGIYEAYGRFKHYSGSPR